MNKNNSFRKLLTGFCSFSLKKSLSSSKIKVILEGRDRTTCAQSPNCGDNGNTEFASCLHNGHRYSPLKIQENVQNKKKLL